MRVVINGTDADIAAMKSMAARAERPVHVWARRILLWAVQNGVDDVSKLDAMSLNAHLYALSQFAPPAKAAVEVRSPEAIGGTVGGAGTFNPWRL